MMKLLFMMWSVIDSILFLLILPPFRKRVEKYTNELPKRSIESEKNLWEKVLDFISEICLLFPSFLIFYIIVHFIPDTGIQFFLSWYIGLFASFVPVVLGWIVEKRIKIDSFWKWSLLVIALLFSIVGYSIDVENVETIIRQRESMNWFLTIFLTVFFRTISKVRKEINKYRLKKISNRGIRVDLYNRTPGLIVNLENMELIKYCEKYFNEYLCRYRKVKGVCSVEYVNLMGIHRKSWYLKTACFIKVFIGLSLFIVTISLFAGSSLRTWGVFGLIAVFFLIIKLYKHVNIDCLYKIAIRYAYNEWGYCLSWKDRYKYVGTVQMIDSSKYHKYVHAFLDVVALCRAVAFNDKMNRECKISIISSNICDLFVNYTDCEMQKNWVMFLPLWQAALFEFDVTGKISKEVKTALNMVSDESVRFDINIFLQSFWADIQRKKLEDGVSDFVRLFDLELYT